MSDKKPAEAIASNDNKEKPKEETPNSSKIPTPASSVTGIPTAASSKLKAPTNFSGSTGSISKIGRPCSHAAPKAGPPPRDANSMSRESDDTMSSINSAYTDLYQETVKRFTRSSLSPEMDRTSITRRSIKSPTTSTSYRSSPSSGDHQTSYDLYLEATGRRRSSDHGAVLTADTEQFIIGQKVWVGGIRPGQIAYIGETHFAPGDWAGVVLDEPNGKNDGCVSGKRYFQCEPKRGIFSRLTRLTLAPLPGAYTSSSPLSKNSPERSRTVSPTASIRSSFLRSPGKAGLTVGDRVIVSSGFGSRPGILRYLGETRFASGNWCGVELDEATGKNDGSVDAIRYFDCKPKYGVFVPIAKVSLSPSSKKSRLTRSGSRESLTSIGTMNSIATTNTSRLRANAQRKSSLIRPVNSTPKSQFSLQDLLREKQNYIEQLMVERDLDREDAQNQALQFQKNISELKSRITTLERQLEDERKKTEDLQFSIDEATFCGDELSGQTQVYKDKVHELELKLSQLASGPASLQIPSSTQEASVAGEAAQALIDELTARLSAQTAAHAAEISNTQDEEKRLQEQIKYLKIENEQLKVELVDKDANLEKFSLSECGMEHLQNELTLLKSEHEKDRQEAAVDFAQKLNERNLEVQLLKDQLKEMSSILSTLQSEFTTREDECEILRNECKSRNEKLETLNVDMEKLSMALKEQKTEAATLQEQLKVQQSSSSAEQTTLTAQVAEIANLRAEAEELRNYKVTLETTLGSAKAEIAKLSETQKVIEDKLKAAANGEAENVTAMQQMRTLIDELQRQVEDANEENERVRQEVQGIQANAAIAEERLQQELNAKETLHAASANELQEAKDTITQLQTELAKLSETSAQDVAAKQKNIESLSDEVKLAQQKVSILEAQSSTTNQEATTRILDLETQLAQLQQQLKANEVELKSKHDECMKQSANLLEKESEIKRTSTAMENISTLLEKLQQEHDNVVDQGRLLEDRVKQGDDRLAQQQLEFGDLTRKYEAINTKCGNISEQNETLQKDILTARKSAADLQAEVRRLNEELAAKQKAFLELQSASDEERVRQSTDVQELKQKLTNADKDFEELKVELNKVRTEVAAKQQQIVTLEEKAIKQELSLSDTQRQQENMKSQYEALSQQNESLQNDLMTLRTSSTDSNAEILKISQELAAKQKAYEELMDKSNQERANIETQLQASKQQVDALCSQVETLTQELKVSSEESFNRFEQLKLEQEKSDRQQLELGDLQRKLQSTTTKCESLEKQNEELQRDLGALRTAATGSNSELLKLTEELSAKQKALHELTDKSSAERLQLEKQVEELTQQLQVNQNELQTIQTELKATLESNATQASDYEKQKLQLQENFTTQLEEQKVHHQMELQKMRESYEAQIKSSEQIKIKLDEGILSLQNQIQLLQAELMKSQLDFKTKEEEFLQRLTELQTQNQKLSATLEEAQRIGFTNLNSVQQEKVELLQSIQQLKDSVQKKDASLQQITGELEQQKLALSNANSELDQLKSQLESQKSTLELTKDELNHKSKLAEEDRIKVEEFKRMMDALQQSNANISATNAELAAALQVLEEEKCETAHIFELFEMESDQNAQKLVEVLSNIKQQLADTQKALQEREAVVKQLQEENAKFQAAAADQVVERQRLEEMELKLNEYKQAVDEMDDAATAKTSNLAELQQSLAAAEQARANAIKQQEVLQAECINLKRKLEAMDLEKTREIVALQGRVNQLQTIRNLDNAVLHDNGDSTAQINFLNSIIADMQRKNDTLKAKIEALEAIPTDFTKPEAFEIFTKRKPAPRLFCDICDEFDKHETEDCPLQSSDARDSPLPSLKSEDRKDRKLPEPRKYCESCEMFGHDTGNCDDECY